jgi:ADP-ribosyl-[dinitrogen reductase] hydrolase
MAVLLAESLTDRSRFDLHDIGERYLQWWKEGAFDTGPIAARVLERVDHGETFDAAALAVRAESGPKSAGCNPAHRCPPLAMASWISLGDLPRYAEAKAKLTHLHPVAADSAAATAVMCRLLILGMGWKKALDRAGEGRDDAVRYALKTRARDFVVAGGYAPDVIAAAVFFLDGADNFSDAMERSLDFAGPANYCPVLVGALGGARWGRTSIPKKWLPAQPIRVRLESAAGRLSDGWPKG